MTIMGIATDPPLPPKLDRLLKEQVQALLGRYGVAEVLREISAQRPALDIAVTQHQEARKTKGNHHG